MNARLFSFLCCVTSLVLGEGSALPVGDLVVQCSEAKVKVHEQCRSEASLCQAVENFTLALTCSQCDDNDTVTWLFSPGRQKDYFHSLSQQNKTLLLAAVDVTKEKASGCYQCRCDSSEARDYFTVQVELPVPPTLLVETVEDRSPTDFDLIPSVRNVPLDVTSPGVVCINCSAIGYPDLQYKWTYNYFGGDWKNASSDPCMMYYDNQPEVLCFTPTVDNVLQQLTYQCEVSNIFQTVTAQQTIIYPGFAESSDWFVRPHQSQSRGAIPLIDGTATAVCAAYQQTEVSVQVEYYVCALPDVANASLSACLFNSLNCCSCRDDSCQLGINVTQDTLVDSLGIPTYGCRVDSTVEGNFACVVEKNVSTDGSYSAKQFIGNFSFLPGMTASAMYTSSDIVLLAVSASGGVILGVILVLVPCCLVMVCCCVRRKRVDAEERRVGPARVYDEDEAGEGEREPLLEHSGINAEWRTMVDYNATAQDTIEQNCTGPGPPLAVPHTKAGPSPQTTSAEQSSDPSPPKPSHVRKALSDSPQPQRLSDPTPPYSARTDPSDHLSSLLSAALPIQKVYLTEGEDQEAALTEVSWSVDATQKSVLSLPLKPGTSYTVEVPPRQEALVLKFKTFGGRRWTEPLPSDIDDVVPVTITRLVKFVGPLAHRWDRIGHNLGVKNVKELLSSQGDGTTKMTRIFETWEESKPSWNDLLRVLEDVDMQLISAASSIRAFLHKEYSKVRGGGCPSPVEHSDQN